MKIATWNVNSINVRMPQLLGWLDKNELDVVCFQETENHR
jgi:exodeoxyribonuclease-3